ncbi:MAG: hypothetical protein LUD81_03275 [Clostridiales bacterium]|nr:hypothetical protein [Clostridiales bacterium]
MKKEKNIQKKEQGKILEEFLRKKAVAGEPVPEELEKILSDDEKSKNGGL